MNQHDANPFSSSAQLPADRITTNGVLLYNNELHSSILTDLVIRRRNVASLRLSPSTRTDWETLSPSVSPLGLDALRLAIKIYALICPQEDVKA